jgi:hypothetical protein
MAVGVINAGVRLLDIIVCVGRAILCMPDHCFVMVARDCTDYWYPNQGWQAPALTFFGIGFVTCVPGTYAMRIVWHVWRGTPGYSLSQLPVVR